MAGTDQFAALVQKVLDVVFEPFQTWDRFISAVSHGVQSYSADLNSKTAFPYLLSSLLVAWIIYRVDRRSGRIEGAVSFAQFMFPRAVYLHPSAIADYKFAAIDLSIKLLVYAPLFSGISWLVYKGLRSVLQPFSIDLSATMPFALAFMPGLVGFLLADFGFFLSHYLMHKVPLLWVFHEVHHSAQVLTPVTVHRVHPIEDLINALIGSSLVAVGAATYSSLSSQEVGLSTIFGVNVISFIFFAFAFQLRHSHVWLPYGPLISRILISPAQHQVHHSLDPKHWNKNFGFTFAFWDAFFGSLYVPRSREALRFGLPYGDPSDFSGVAKLYFLPFVKAMKVLGVRREESRKVERATPP